MRYARFQVAWLFSVCCWIPAGIPATAADAAWLAPDASRPETGEVVVRLFDANGPRDAASGSRIQRLWLNGRQSLQTSDDGAASFTAREPGLQLIAYEEPTRFCKAFVVVGHPAENGQLHLSELGHRLEIVPQTNPIGLVRGVGDFELQVLFEREPLALAVVEARLLDADGSSDTGDTRFRQGPPARTDEIGTVRLSLGTEGRWLIRVRHEVEGETVVSTLLVEREDGR